MAIPSCFTAAQAQPADSLPSPWRTRASNATARPGLPDMPASRRTSEQKHADNELARNEQDAKKAALKGAYQRIGGMQATMATEQAEAKKARPAMLPKWPVIEPEFKKPAIPGPRILKPAKKLSL
ncbi:hypothetical protein J3R83DRAFT_3962 [Lanmaoa asiatica]|nr:hypothetical protein J3R83DRAFT_3962 [Lanmaoa asiatica]